MKRILILTACFISASLFIVHDFRIDPRIKIMHPILQTAFWASGIHKGGKVNREVVNTLIDVPHFDVGYDAETDTTSADVFIPFQLNISSHNVRVRVFKPTSLKKKVPVMVFMHGGGLVIGNATAYDAVPRYLAHSSNVIVMSVDYRLAPEHPFPAAIYDVYSVFRWLSDKKDQSGADFLQYVDRDHVLIGGECAGGGLALLMTYISRDNILPMYDPLTKTITETKIEPLLKLQTQVLIYPFLPENTPSKSLQNTYILTQETMKFLWETATKGFEASKDNALLHPYRTRSLTGLPEAIIVTPEFSLLRDDGSLYASKLTEAGVKVHHRMYPAPHSFIQFTFLKQTKEAKMYIADTLRNILNG
jgi:acetyl esterase